MLIELPWIWVAVLNIVLWPVLQIFLAWAFTRMPDRWFVAPHPMPWERRGRLYEDWFRVKRWKDRLPDGASWFAGGVSKRRLGGTSENALAAFARETWRGELCHWTAMACTPVFFLWNPLWADGVMVIYAVLANGPCLIAQRYNRARIMPRLSCRN